MRIPGTAPALVRAALKAAFPSGIRRLTARSLIRWHPGAVRELMHLRALSFWYRTVRSPHEQTLWAYADRHSIRPGEPFRLMMSAGPGRGGVEGHAEIFRIGYYGSADRRFIWRSARLEIAEHGITGTAAALGPAWPAALVVEDTADWRSGYHSVDFVEHGGRRHEDVAFIVVRAPTPDTGILVKLATATYQAYNRWGGHNLYLYETPATMAGGRAGVFEEGLPFHRGDMVTFDRPTASEFWEWEYWFVLWLERLAREEGISLAYATGFDIAREPDLAARCRLLISVGHDEYWSREEFDHTHGRIFRLGGNTLFLGANTAYWQVRYADVNAPGGNEPGEGRQMICYKAMADPIRRRAAADPDLHVTARFREDARRPESMLTGVAYQSNLAFRQAESGAAYYVADTDFPFFEGTGYCQGDFVAGIIGHEWDNRDPEAEFPCPGEPRVAATERLWREGRSLIAPIAAERIRPVFRGGVVDINGRRGCAEAVCFESPAGARVFSAGTNRWSWGLGKEGYVQEPFRRLNRNLVMHFLKD